MPLTPSLEKNLRHELLAEEGTFLAEARRGRFDETLLFYLSSNLVQACELCENDEHFPRWLAELFYWSSVHLDRHLPPGLGILASNQSNLQEHFDLLASWFFTGVCPFQSAQTFDKEIQEICASIAASN